DRRAEREGPRHPVARRDQAEPVGLDRRHRADRNAAVGADHLTALAARCAANVAEGSRNLPYFSRAATLAMPARAQASSCSSVDPALPTAPMVSVPIWIGTPPLSARMSARSRCAALPGFSAVRF